jgi:KaiC/GvpD/RAD55 family RecA-like ATPase
MIYNDSKKKRETKTYNEQYNEDSQRNILNMLLSDPEAFALCRTILNEDYFDDRLRPAVRFIMQYADENSILPAIEQVKAKTGITVEKFSEGGMHTRALTKDVEQFCQYKAMELAVLDGVDLLQTGRASEIVERAKAALTISLMSELGTDYFYDPETRLLQMRDKSSYVPTGWKTLDDKLYGGFTKGGLNIYCGQSGSGKSIFLQNLAINWALMGYNVLYITLELSEDLIAIRLDAMVTGRGTSEVLKDIKETVLRIRGTSMRDKPGKLYVKKLPEGGTTVNTLRAYIKEFQIKTGLKPDALVIDYLDLMYPTNTKIDPSDHFVKDKYVAEEIRALMHETDTFGSTASQLNRNSHAQEVHEFDHSHIAGGISKINTADNVFGIITNYSMKEKGLYKLQFLKTRSSSAVGQTIDLAYDPISMRITDMLIDDSMPLNKDYLRQSLMDKRKPTPSVPKNNDPEPPQSSVLSRLRKQAGNGDV